MRGRRRVLAAILQALILIAFIGVWETAARRRWIDPFFFSQPSAFGLRALRWLTERSFLLGGRSIYHHLLVTLEEMAGGFVLGVVFGVAVGFLLGRSDFWSSVFNPYIQVLNALPRLVLAPVFVLLFGIDERSKIALGFSLVFFIVFFNAYRGVREVDRNLVNNVRMLGASEKQLAWHVLLPSAMTWILSSLHTSVGFALVGAVVGEYMAAAQGLGWIISQAEGNFDAAGVYAGILVLGVVVVVVEFGVTWLENRLLAWKKPQEGRNFIPLVLVVVSFLLLSGCTRSQEKTTIQMAVGGQTQFIYLPLTLADRLGYFKDEGLTINISDLRGGSEALAAMMGGSVDMVTGFYEHTIRARAQGKRLVMVVLFDRYPGLVLMVGKQHVDQVHSIRDLVGKPVGVTAPGSSTDQLVKYILRQSNLDPQSIPVVTGGISTMLAALEQNHVWAGVTVDPLASRLARDGTASVLYDTRTEKGTVDIFGGPWPAGGFYTTVEFIQQHPRTVESMVRAAVRGLRYLRDHSAEDVASAMPESFWGGDRDQYIQALRADIGMYSPDGVMPSDGPPNVFKTLSLVDKNIAGMKLDLQETYNNSYALTIQ